MAETPSNDDHGLDGNDDHEIQIKDINRSWQWICFSKNLFGDLLSLKPTLASTVCGGGEDAMGARLRWLRPTVNKYLRPTVKIYLTQCETKHMMPTVLGEQGFPQKFDPHFH